MPVTALAGWRWRSVDSQAHVVTTRLGFAIIIAGAVLLVLVATGVVDDDIFSIVSMLAIVLAALVIAIDGESADQNNG